jgi:hypothetical protein
MKLAESPVPRAPESGGTKGHGPQGRIGPQSVAQLFQREPDS